MPPSATLPVRCSVWTNACPALITRAELSQSRPRRVGLSWDCGGPRRGTGCHDGRRSGPGGAPGGLRRALRGGCGARAVGWLVRCGDGCPAGVIAAGNAGEVRFRDGSHGGCGRRVPDGDRSDGAAVGRYQRYGRRTPDQRENARCREPGEPARRTLTVRDMGGSWRDGGHGWPLRDLDRGRWADVGSGESGRRRDWRGGGLDIGSQRLDGPGQRRAVQLLELGAAQPHLRLITVALGD